MAAAQVQRHCIPALAVLQLEDILIDAIGNVRNVVPFPFHGGIYFVTVNTSIEKNMGARQRRICSNAVGNNSLYTKIGQ